MNKPDEKRLKPSWMAQVTAPKEYVLEYLEKEGIGHKVATMDPKMCKPLQNKIDLAKAQGIQEAMDKNEPLGPIYLSGDDEILDGHHRAFAAIRHPDVEGIACIKLYLEHKDAMRVLNKIQDIFSFEQEHGINAGENMGNMAPQVATMAQPIESAAPQPAVMAKPIAMAEEDKEEAPVSVAEVKPEGGADQATDEHLPSEAVPSTPGSATQLVGFETAGHNPKQVKGYKAKPLNTQARTGDFLFIEKNPTVKFEYNLSFENLLEITPEQLEGIGFPTEAVLQEWLPGADYAQEAKSQGLSQEVYMSREVNRMALQKGFDGIQYGKVLLQVINKTV